MSAAPSLVLLVHGFASSAELSWHRTGWIDVLADTGRTTIAPDLMGHGGSPKPTDPAEYATGVEDGVLAALDESGAEGPVDAVGFSMGARVLLVLAGRHPARFRRLVAAGYGAELVIPPDATAREAVAQSVEGRRDPVDPISRAFRQAALTPPNDPAALAACLRREAPPLVLGAVPHPTLVVAGDADPMAWPPDQMVAGLPDATICRLKGADHLGTAKDFRFLDAAIAWFDR